ncbi:hypothetical protein MKK84_02495 [Methylobacterium sp. E-065]|uniref:hypothetical protein n=1 Tax=Methylobacterium sp. E-065 TaxID=2836583 RepID=UPI001FBAADD0|nr:hypothetical protein [Methylobacterium sp. E-065]MCJ2016305.1 hypothetical protein [Methylobacterium sp. E-065]
MCKDAFSWRREARSAEHLALEHFEARDLPLNWIRRPGRRDRAARRIHFALEAGSELSSGVLAVAQNQFARPLLKRFRTRSAKSAATAKRSLRIGTSARSRSGPPLTGHTVRLHEVIKFATEAAARCTLMDAPVARVQQIAI